MSRLRLWWDSLLYTLWFVPSLMMVAGALLAVAMVIASGHVDDEVLARWPRVFGADAGSSRDMLATIAGSIITVAGVTFSITMITVTQASTQYTPRILRNFMRDRPSQVTLGGLAGVFTYCLVVLRTIRGGEESMFVPALAVLTGFILAAASVGLLIYFVHHTASSLQASSIIKRVADDTERAIDRLFPSDVGTAAGPPAVPAAARLLDTLAWTPVAAAASGYVQSLDAAGNVSIQTVTVIVADVNEFVPTPKDALAAFEAAGPGAADGGAASVRRHVARLAPRRRAARSRAPHCRARRSPARRG